MNKKIAGKLLTCLATILLADEDSGNEATSELSSQDADFYAAILSHYLHQDAMLWSRVQFLVAIQAAVLAGAVGLRANSHLAAAILLLGASLTLLLFWLVLKDELDRDVNLPILDALARRLTAQRFASLNLDPRTPVRLAAARRPWYIPLRGRQILHISIILLFLLDMALGLCFVAAPAAIGAVLSP